MERIMIRIVLREKKAYSYFAKGHVHKAIFAIESQGSILLRMGSIKSITRTYWKEFALCVLSAASNISAFWAWRQVIAPALAGEFWNYRQFILPASLLIVGAVCFSLAGLLVRNQALLVLWTIIAVLVPYFFALPITLLTVSVMILHLFFSLAAFSLIRKKVVVSLEYRVSRFLRGGLSLYLTMASLLISLFYFNQVDERKVFSLFLPRPVFDFTIRSFSGTLHTLTGFPRIAPEQTVDEVLEKMLRDQLASQGISFDAVGKEELNRLLNMQRAEFMKNFETQLGGHEKIGTVFYAAVSDRIKNILGPYQRYLHLGSAIVFFLTFKTMTVPLYFISVFLTFLLIKLLIFANVIRKEKESVEVERLIL